MTTPPRRRPTRSLPPEHAFVVQLEADLDFTNDHVGGRVEHVVSGNGTQFRNLTELMQFLRSATQPQEPLASEGDERPPRKPTERNAKPP